MTNSELTSQPKKIFLLGVGAQKSGTTWMRAYLNGHENCDFGIKKEHHVLDVHFPPHNVRYKKRYLNWYKKFAKKVKAGKIDFDAPANPRHTRDMKMLSFYYDIQEYYDYFCALAHRAPNISVVGEITPAYAELPESALQDVKAQMERRGFDVKILFMMRDPIERLHSLVRMRARESTLKGEADIKSDNDCFMNFLTRQAHHVRCRYEITLKTLESVFEPENIHYVFYEEMFATKDVSGITEFLGLSPRDADFGVKKNVTQKKEALTPEVIAEARKVLAPTYDYVAAKFPDTDLKSVWKHF